MGMKLHPKRLRHPPEFELLPAVRLEASDGRCWVVPGQGHLPGRGDGPTAFRSTGRFLAAIHLYRFPAMGVLSWLSGHVRRRRLDVFAAAVSGSEAFQASNKRKRNDSPSQSETATRPASPGSQRRISGNWADRSGSSRVTEPEKRDVRWHFDL